MATCGSFTVNGGAPTVSALVDLAGGSEKRRSWGGGTGRRTSLIANPKFLGNANLLQSLSHACFQFVRSEIGADFAAR